MSARDRIVSSIRRRYQREPHAGSGAIEGLRDTWSRYPAEWRKDPQLNLGFTTLGDEWGGPDFADFIIDLVSPYIGSDADVIELGCGGGKFSQRLAPRCRSLLCTDISVAMLTHTRNNLAKRQLDGNVSYVALNGVDFEEMPPASADLIFSYDVLLHLQPQNVFSYMFDARRVLRDGGVFMLHQINLDSEGGMAHFLEQYSAGTWKHGFEDPRRRGHVYFMSQDQMSALATHAGLVIDRIVSDQGEFNGVTGWRDLIGFLRKRPSRLEGRQPDSVRLLKSPGDSTVYVVLDGQRVALNSARQFERARFRWQSVEEIDERELDQIPDGGALEPWE